MRLGLFLFSLFAIAGIVAVYPPTTAFAENDSDYTVCKNHKEVRTIHVGQNPANKNCQTRYTKYGKEIVSAEGQNRVTCTDAVKKIRTNLEKGGWTCREVQNATTIDEK